ncbi:hypothetical protein FHG87_009623 [Trinorchestia longiramus]|nr:hypothetical protein FHG87_009623 [Trinorchestia longiramus]
MSSREGGRGRGGACLIARSFLPTPVNHHNSAPKYHTSRIVGLREGQRQPHHQKPPSNYRQHKTPTHPSNRTSNFTHTTTQAQSTYNHTTHSINITSHQSTANATYRVQLLKIDMSRQTKIFRNHFYHLNVSLIILTENNSSYNTITDETTVVDVLSSPKARQRFKKINLKPIILPDLCAKMTVFLCQVYSSIRYFAPILISKEITKHQHWVKTPEISKNIPQTHIIKITFTDIATTEKVLQNGLLMCNTKITLTEIEVEKYTHRHRVGLTS